MRKFLFIISLLTCLTTFGQDKNHKLEITRLTSDFYIYTTYGDLGNGSLYPANGMYLVTNKGVVLFDSPWDKTQFQPLLDSIQAKHNRKVIMCIATHFHDDRTAGLDYYRQKGIKTYTTKQTDELSKAKNQPRAEYLIEKDTIFNIGQYQFETFYPGKGHAPDNIVIWFGNKKVLYGGCFIKSTETNSPGNLSDANIDEWIKSIKRVQAKCPNPDFVIPGHQDWKSKKSLQHTLSILKKYQKKTRQDNDSNR
jgi:glyoxylase-like metal-dependent hydrolase (beta-lactamase superfamily II)